MTPSPPAFLGCDLPASALRVLASAEASCGGKGEAGSTLFDVASTPDRVFAASVMASGGRSEKTICAPHIAIVARAAHRPDGISQGGIPFGVSNRIRRSRKRFDDHAMTKLAASTSNLEAVVGLPYCTMELNERSDQCHRYNG